MQPMSPGGTTPRSARGHVRVKDKDIGPPTASATQDTGPAADYPRFHAAVSLAQLTAWLDGFDASAGGFASPRAEPQGDGMRVTPDPGDHRKASSRRARFLIDISGPGARVADVAARAGHRVLRVVRPGTAAPELTRYEAGGRVCTVAADATGLEFLADGCADGVIAEDGTLSRTLAAEALVGEIARVLRPGGRVLACVDSLTYGMAVLAEQHRWPNLADVPNADVVLVPWPDGTYTRCYGARELAELFTECGLEVSWIRPRTVFSPDTVSYLLSRSPGRFSELVAAELQARCDDSVGAQLITCAVKSRGIRPLPSSAVPLRLARDTARRRRTGFQAGLGDQVPAVHAAPVAAVVDPGKRGDYLGPLRLRRRDRGGVPVGLGQVGASIARLRTAAPGQRMLAQQDRDGAVQVDAHFLKALTGNADFHVGSSGGESRGIRRGAVRSAPSRSAAR